MYYLSQYIPVVTGRLPVYLVMGVLMSNWEVPVYLVVGVLMSDWEVPVYLSD
jgi:hypothetical protein